LRCERSSTRSLVSFRRCCLLPQSSSRCTFAAGASITSFGPRCTITARVPYALVTCFSTGRPWSEQALGADFDIRHGCSCARYERFTVHMSVDCMGLGPYNVAKRTSFNTEAEDAAALLHAAKSKMLCELRSVSVCKDDVLRLRVHPESLGLHRSFAACRLTQNHHRNHETQRRST
jgi:hypothetical protein